MSSSKSAGAEAVLGASTQGNGRCLEERHQKVLSELERLVHDTYLLWDQQWVGFNWRNYTFEHVQRVRALSRLLGQAEGADRLVLEYASLLHDITKGYDGEIITRNGQRVLDENGLWRNEVLMPARHNTVTRIYEENRLAGQLHSESGATVAMALMARYGLDEALRERVGAVIRAHLRPGDDAPIEERVLYDADTIDANVGLPAIHRFINIVLHREEVQKSQQGEDFEAWIHSHRVEFLRWFLCERVPTWLGSKKDDFVSRLTTEAGRTVGSARIDNLKARVQQLVDELPAVEENLRTGGLRVLDYLIDHRENAKMSVQMEELLALIPEDAGFARQLVVEMTEEMRGLR